MVSPLAQCEIRPELGSSLVLKYDTKAIVRLEELYGMGIAGILQENQFGLRFMRNAIVSGLVWKNDPRRYGLEAVEKMLDNLPRKGTPEWQEVERGDRDSFEDVAKKVSKALAASMPGVSEEEIAEAQESGETEKADPLP